MGECLPPFLLPNLNQPNAPPPYPHPTCATPTIVHVCLSSRLGIPDSNILLMLADDMACNARNPYPGRVRAHYCPLSITRLRLKMGGWCAMRGARRGPWGYACLCLGPLGHVVPGLARLCKQHGVRVRFE